MRNKLSKNRDSRDRLRYRSGLVQKLWQTKGAVALALMGLILPTYNFGESKLSATEPENLIAQASNPQTQPGQQNDTNQQGEQNIQQQRRENVTIEEVTDKLNAVVGQTITIRGKLVERRGNNAFLITDEDFLGSEEVLVVNTSSDPLNLPNENIQVQATGVVRDLPLKQVAQQYNLDLADWFTRYRDKPVVIAQSVAPAPEPSDITGNPSPYYGRAIAVPADIQNVYNPNTFVLGGELLALVVNPKQNFNPSVVNQGEKVVATGRLRPFVIADLERDYNLTLESGLRAQLEKEYARKPVLIVNGVYPSALPDTAASATQTPSATAPTPTTPAQPDNQAQTPSAAPPPATPAQPGTDRAPQQRENVTSEEVVNKTAALVGKTVTVRGEFIEKIGDRTFTIADEQFLGVESILVVNVSDTPLNIPSDDLKVQVTGEVRRFSLEEISKKYNQNFDRATYALYENQPAIIAKSVAPAPEPSEINEEPKTYYGRRVAVPGDVTNIYGPTAFVLSNDLLVLNPKPSQRAGRIKEGEKVVVTGTVRQFVVDELEKEYGLDWDADLQSQLEKEYANRPVLVGEVSAYPSAVEQ